MSQTELAKAVGITFQQIQKYEKGVNRIGSSRLVQIANALSVPPTHFFEAPFSEMALDGDQPSMEMINGFIASSDGVRLMESFMRIKNKSLKTTILKLVGDLEP